MKMSRKIFKKFLFCVFSIKRLSRIVSKLAVNQRLPQYIVSFICLTTIYMSRYNFEWFKELPEDLEALKSLEWIIMDLDKKQASFSGST